jgi:type IV secretion system protein VirD4
MSDTILGSTAPEGIELGRTYGGKIIRTNRDHLLLFGGTGSGKGTSVLMPNLLDMRGNRSIFVIDPKAELAAVTARWRSTVSHIALLNPFGVLTNYQGYDDLRGVGFAPLAGIDPESDDFNLDASLLAEAMISIDSKTQPYFEQAARTWVAAVIMYVVIVAWQRGDVPSMARVRQLLCLDAQSMTRLAKVMMNSWCVGLRNKAAQFTKWTNEISGVANTARVQTEWIDDPQISRSMARDDFDFATLKKVPTTVYVILPPETLDRHSKYLRLLVTCALRKSMRPREAGEPSVLFMLDEFAALGHLKIVEQAWTLVRGYGIQLMAVFQDLLQLQGIYKERWGSLLANTGAALFFRPNDMTTADWLSKRLGETTRMLQTMNQAENQSGGQNSGKSTSPTGESLSGGASSGWGFSRSFNTSPVKVPLSLPHELFGLRNGEMRAFLAGVKDGLTLEAVPYFDIENRDLRARRNPYVHDVPRRRDLPPPVGDARGSGFDWSAGLRQTRPAPSPAPWRRPRTLPPPPALRGLPHPEDPRDWEDSVNDRF